MGYSIKVSAKSVGLRDKMVQFLKDNDTSWTAITADSVMPGDPNYDCTYNGPILGEDLVYNSTKSSKAEFGYYYNAGAGASREWAYTLLRFAAARVGRRKSFNPPFDSGPKVKAPYIIYDEYESFPVWTRSDWDSSEFSSEEFFEQKIAVMLNSDDWVYETPSMVLLTKKYFIKNKQPLVGDYELLQAADQWEAVANAKLAELAKAWEVY